MNHANAVRIERNIAQCRLLLSVVSPLAVYLDPTQPILTWFLPVSGAAFFIDPRALFILLGHLAYSVVMLGVLQASRVRLRPVVAVSTWGDVVFGAAVALVTEGTNSPFYVFFLFAVLAAGLRGTPRTAVAVTVASLAIYVGLLVVAQPAGVGFYLIRAVYLAITGYLVGFLGRQRQILQSNLDGLSRSLHDGYAQALAGVNLRVNTCRELVRQGRTDEAFVELTELQGGVVREYDELRAHVRSLQGLASSPAPGVHGGATAIAVHARLEAPLAIVEHALLIMLEGARNVSRHARARSAVIDAEVRDGKVLIAIDDDGIGFHPDAAPPWSIASRAAEVGGRVAIRDRFPSGARLLVELPTA